MTEPPTPDDLQGQAPDGKHAPDDRHEHSHGLVDPSIKRSRGCIRAVAASLGVLAVAAIAQTLLFALSGSVALLADLVHNYGDALTALPLAVAFAMRSAVAERRAGLAVIAALFISACVAGVEAVERIINPAAPSHLIAVAAAGAIGFVGNLIASRIRLRAGTRYDSAALIADGRHARADAYVSLGVVLSAALVAVGAQVADPLVALAITAVILRITWQSWQALYGADS